MKAIHIIKIVIEKNVYDSLFLENKGSHVLFV